MSEFFAGAAMMWAIFMVVGIAFIVVPGVYIVVKELWNDLRGNR